MFTDDSTDLPEVDPLSFAVFDRVTNYLSGTPYLGCAVGGGLKGSGIFHGDILLMNPVGPYRGGDLVGAIVGGVAVLRCLTIVRSIPHLISEHPPQVSIAIETPLIGIVRTLLRVNCCGKLKPRVDVQYSQTTDMQTLGDDLTAADLKSRLMSRTGTFRRKRETRVAGDPPRPKGDVLLNETSSD